MTEKNLLEEALFHLRKVRQYAHRDLSDEVVQDAVALRLVAMIEALGRLEEASQQEYLGNTWRLMRGMRNRIVHGYMGVDPEVINVTVHQELPLLEQTLLDAIAEIVES